MVSIPLSHKAHHVPEQIPELLTCQAKVSMTPLFKGIKTSTQVVCGFSPKKRSIASTVAPVCPSPIWCPATHPKGAQTLLHYYYLFVYIHKQDTLL